MTCQTCDANSVRLNRSVVHNPGSSNYRATIAHDASPITGKVDDRMPGISPRNLSKIYRPALMLPAHPFAPEKVRREPERF
jgi:hypothetical protein